MQECNDTYHKNQCSVSFHLTCRHSAIFFIIINQKALFGLNHLLLKDESPSISSVFAYGKKGKKSFQKCTTVNISGLTLHTKKNQKTERALKLNLASNIK